MTERKRAEKSWVKKIRKELEKRLEKKKEKTDPDP